MIGRTFLIFLIMINFCNAEDTFDHNDPVLRRQVLDYASQLANSGKFNEASGFYIKAIKNWQSEDQKSDLVEACDHLFGLLFSVSKQNSKKQLLGDCPEERIEYWYGKSDREIAAMLKYAPAYPDKAVRNKLEGWAIAIYDVDKKGRTRNVRIKESSNSIFEKPSKRAAKKFKYLPARKNGELVEVKDVENRFTFELQERR